VTNQNFIFTSESVSEGHPDKVADQISDGVLDAFLALDPASHVACETLVKNDTVVVAGEITSKGKVDYEKTVRETIRRIGYTDPTVGFSADTCEVVKLLCSQSPDISQGVAHAEDDSSEQGAGDQGLMFGFACCETEELMPLPISLAHRLVSQLADLRKSGRVDCLRPDAKSQVSVRYENGKPSGIETLVISTQHTDDVTIERLRELLWEEVVQKVVPSRYLDKQTRFLVNPTGRFVVGGPVGDCGLTGRKIIVDTYGGYSRHGGGAFSGKDPSKVDRSAAYMARHIAKNIVGAGIADKCEVQLAYAIGIAEPVSVMVDTFSTGKKDDAQIAQAVREIFSLTPRGIIRSLNLLRPIYQATAAYGHFGRTPSKDGHFSWEELSRVEELQAALGVKRAKACCN
jgi:S-adenosylmethionine synthetase